jgi:hypothetical protein
LDRIKRTGKGKNALESEKKRTSRENNAVVRTRMFCKRKKRKTHWKREKNAQEKKNALGREKRTSKENNALARKRMYWKGKNAN